MQAANALSMPSKVIIIVIEFMFLDINIFWALLRVHFNPRLTARAKMTLSRAQNIFMPAIINSIVLLMHFFGSDLPSERWQFEHQHSSSVCRLVPRVNSFVSFLQAWDRTWELCPDHLICNAATDG